MADTNNAPATRPTYTGLSFRVYIVGCDDVRYFLSDAANYDAAVDAARKVAAADPFGETCHFALVSERDDLLLTIR